MQFYIYQGSNGDKSWPASVDKAAIQERVCTIAQKSAAFHRTLREDVCFFVSSVSEVEIVGGVICAEQIPLQKRLDVYLNAVGLLILNGKPEEVTFRTLLDLLRGAERRDYIRDYHEILEHFDLDDLRRYPDCIECSESLIEERRPEFIYAAAENHFLNEMLRPELERIYAGKPITRHVGHPVHYLLQTDDDDSRKYGYRLRSMIADGCRTGATITWISAPETNSPRPSTIACTGASSAALSSCASVPIRKPRATMPIRTER